VSDVEAWIFTGLIITNAITFFGLLSLIRICNSRITNIADVVFRERE
jgi:hypothetical protein